MKKYYILLLLLFCAKLFLAQTDTIPFDAKKEIAYDGKRYRVYNNWVSLGGGLNYNTKWPKDERNLAVDYSFHIQQYYFRLGAFMSGRDFTSPNNNSFHAGIGIRKEREKYNLSAFIGPSTSYFRRPLRDSLTHNLAKVYNAAGGYACVEIIYKIKYDVGIGGQLFCDYNEVQMVYGVRLVAYFSGAYRGVKYGYQKPAKK